jgi:hypothetical protein
VATPRARLGHYSSSDGLSGFVLDRTPRTPRVLVDGTSNVVELGVRDHGGGVVSLESAGGDLVLTVDDAGKVTNISDARRDVPLHHDADAQPLPEPLLPVVDVSLIRSLEARAKAKCGSVVHFEVRVTAGAAGGRGAYHTLQRCTRAVEAICRDKAGQVAVRRKLTTVRIAQAPVSRSTLDGAVLLVETDLESPALGPFSDEVRGFLESKL